MDQAGKRLQQARALRADASMPERVLWNIFRGRGLDGIKFHRQQPIGRYIADFYCAEARIVVEIDGAVHSARAARDSERDAWMMADGILVLRFSASLCSRDADAVAMTVMREARKRSGAVRLEGGVMRF